jgi:formylglycine-generating enzyme
MKKRSLLSLLLVCLSLAWLLAQTKLVHIPGGTAEVSGGYQFVYEGAQMRLIDVDEQFSARNAAGPLIGDLPQSNVPERTVSVSSFFISPKEVTNAEYRAFLRDSVLKGDARASFETQLKGAGKDDVKLNALWNALYTQAAARNLLPDSSCWTRDFPKASNSPMAAFYFSHPAFDHYPVVGVSWPQANAYCAWMTARNNAARAAKDLPAQPRFRLPTEAEWEFAALGGIPGKQHARNWLQPQHTHKGLAYTASIKNAPAEYMLDNYMYTAPPCTFPPNAYGLYDMAGNAAEWTLDAFRPLRIVGAPEPEAGFSEVIRVVKGGSWADVWQATVPGSRCAVNGDAGHARVGFRIVMSDLSSTGTEH